MKRKKAVIAAAFISGISLLLSEAAALPAYATEEMALGGAPAAGAGQAITKVAKGTAAASITGWTATTSKAYTIAATPTSYDDATAAAAAAKIYLYIDSATAPSSGDKAAFRYAGGLSTAKSGWTSTDDLKGIEIKYDIAGISATVYDDVKDDLTYGFKAEADDTLTLVDGVLTAKIKVADFASGSLKIGDTTAELGSKAGTWGGADDAVTFTFNTTWADAMKGKTCVATVKLKDGSTLTASFDVPN